VYKRITGFEELVHHRNSEELENNLFPSSGEKRQTRTLSATLKIANPNHWTRFPLGEEPNIVGVSLSSPEEGNRFSFPNVVF
jgi:hypothetical protein